MARDAVGTVRHSASLTRSLIEENLPKLALLRGLSGPGIRLRDEIAGSARGVASSMAEAFLPPQIRFGSGPQTWQDLVTAAADPDACRAYAFSNGARAILTSIFAARGGAKALVSQSRLYSAYRAAIEMPREREDGLDFLAALIVKLDAGDVVLDVRTDRGAQASGRAETVPEAVFALGLFMAAAVDTPEGEWKGLLDSAVDLTDPLADEIAAAIGDVRRVRDLLAQYRDHL